MINSSKFTSVGAAPAVTMVKAGVKVIMLAEPVVSSAMLERSAKRLSTEKEIYFLVAKSILRMTWCQHKGASWISEPGMDIRAEPVVWYSQSGVLGLKLTAAT